MNQRLALNGLFKSHLLSLRILMRRQQSGMPSKFGPSYNNSSKKTSQSPANLKKGKPLPKKRMSGGRISGLSSHLTDSSMLLEYGGQPPQTPSGPKSKHMKDGKIMPLHPFLKQGTMNRNKSNLPPGSGLQKQGTRTGFSNPSLKAQTDKDHGEDNLARTYSFEEIDLQENEAFAEPAFVRQHKDEFQRFLKQRPDLVFDEFTIEDQKSMDQRLIKESAQSARLHYSQSMSPISTLGKEPRCGRYLKNFGREAIRQLKERDLDLNHDNQLQIASGSLSFRSPKKWQYMSTRLNNNTMTATSGQSQKKQQLPRMSASVTSSYFDKDRLKNELNQLVDYRKRRLQVLEKLKADLNQIRTANESVYVFKNHIKRNDSAHTNDDSENQENRQTLANHAYNRRLCCGTAVAGSRHHFNASSLIQSEFSTPSKMEISIKNIERLEIKNRRVSAIPQNWNIKIFSKQLIEDALQPKNRSSAQQFCNEITSRDHFDQQKNSSTAKDDFSIVDLEFRRVELHRLLNIKQKQLDEALMERESLKAQNANEQREKIFNRKKLLDSIPNYEEHQAMEAKFQYIASMGTFDKLVAQHMVKIRRDELLEVHEERQGQVMRLLRHLKHENDELHKYSGELEKKQHLLDTLKYEVSEVRIKQHSLNDVKRKWVRILRQKFRESRKCSKIRVFVLIQELQNMKHEMHLEAMEQHQDNFLGVVEFTPEQERKRQAIFQEMQHYNLLIKNKLTDFRAYCNAFFESDMRELENLFTQHIKMTTQYSKDKETFYPEQVIKIYNDNQFFISSLSSSHEFLIWKTDNLRETMRGYEKVKWRVLNFCDDILEYLQTADLAKRLNIDVTIDDLLNMRLIQAQKKGKSVIDLNTCIPKAKEFIDNMAVKIDKVTKAVQSIFNDEKMKQEFADYILGLDLTKLDLKLALKTFGNTYGMMEEVQEAELSSDETPDSQHRPSLVGARGIRRQSILAQKTFRASKNNVIIQEIMGSTNAMLDIELDDDPSLLKKEQGNNQSTKKNYMHPEKQLREVGLGIAREIYASEQPIQPPSQQHAEQVTTDKPNDSGSVSLQVSPPKKSMAVKEIHTPHKLSNQQQLKPQKQKISKIILPLKLQIKKRQSLGLQKLTQTFQDHSKMRRLGDEVYLYNLTKETRDQIKKIATFIDDWKEVTTFLIEDLEEYEVEGKINQIKQVGEPLGPNEFIKEQQILGQISILASFPNFLAPIKIGKNDEISLKLCQKGLF